MQITAQPAWARASLSAGTKLCDCWGAGIHPQMPPVLLSQTSGGPQGPSLEKPFTVSGPGGQERPTPPLRPMEPGAAASAQSKQTASGLRVARPTLSAKNKASFKASMLPKSQNTALAFPLVLLEEHGGEELELRVPPGPSQPCSWGGVNT